MKICIDYMIVQIGCGPFHPNLQNTDSNCESTRFVFDPRLSVPDDILDSI